MDDESTTCDNDRWAGATPRLSVLIPFKGDDPTRLLAALDTEIQPVEVIVLDDGSGDDELAARVDAAVRTMRLPARSIRLAENQGRARGRNRLVDQARTDHLLFVDSDMLPDTSTFLETWVQLVERQAPAVAFGGFTMLQTPRRAEHELHRRVAAGHDTLTAAQRSASPARYVFTSNLLVRRDVFAAESFDEQFTGWGWEDVEWGIRVSQRFEIVHIDNTASHLGLDTAAALASKYEQSTQNFARIMQRFPDEISELRLAKTARALRRVPGLVIWRRALRRIAVGHVLPVSVRAFAMRLYRPALYAEVV